MRRIAIGAPNPSGNGVVPIPLADVADVNLVTGPSFIYRENRQRYIPIKFSVRGRDLGGAVPEAQEKLAEKVPLPGGYGIEWAGEFNDLKEALMRLAIVVPVSLALVALLLFFNFGSIADTLLAASVMPMAVVGGVCAVLERYALQRVGGDRVCRAIRHCHDGGNHRAVLFQPTPGFRPGEVRGATTRL